MRKRWLAIFVLPVALSVASCLSTTAPPTPNDEEQTNKEKLPDTNSAIVLVQQDTLQIGN